MDHNENSITRRSILRNVAIGAGMMLTGGTFVASDASGAACSTCSEGGCSASVQKMKNEDFYKDGVFQVEKAREAYYAMFDRFSYPNPKPLQDGIWIMDFGLNDFVNVGMAGIFWINSEENKFFGHEIFLLPGQMIVEHCHVRLPDVAPKMEAWHVRHGMVYTLAEGEPTTPPPIELPASQKDYITAKQFTKLMPGEVDYLKKAESKHFMIAGPEGCICSEYATYHSNDALRFTNPNVKFG